MYHKRYRLPKGESSKTITQFLKTKLVDFGIDRVRYHDGDLEGTSIIQLFQNADKRFKTNYIEIDKSLLMINKELKLRNTLEDVSKYALCLNHYFPCQGFCVGR